MKKLFLFILLFSGVHAFANPNYFGYCTPGAVNALTQGLTSSNMLAGLYPQCKVYVYNQGTTTLATIYKDDSGTPLDNPFKASDSGTYQFYVVSGHYDVTMTGGLNGGFKSPFTIPDVIIQDISTISTQCLLSVCIESAPTSNQSITQPNGTAFTWNFTNCSSGACSLNTSNQTFINNGGTYRISQNTTNYTASGITIDVGSPSSSGAGAGWNEPYLNLSNFTSSVGGINLLYGVSPWYHYGIGDTLGLDFDGHHSGGWVLAADEGVEPIRIIGTQDPAGAQPRGTVTSTVGQGDRTPTFHLTQGTGVVIGGGYFMRVNNSDAVDSGTLPSMAAPVSWYTGGPSPNGFGLNVVPTSNSYPTTNINACTITTAIARSTDPTGDVTSTVNCNLLTGTTPAANQVTNGFAWLISSHGPERVNITVSGSGNTVSVTLNTHYPHGIGSLIIQSPYQGCFVSDADVTATGLYTNFLVVGATANGLIMGTETAQNFTGNTFPFVGAYAASVGSGYHVYDCAQIYGTLSNGAQPYLEQNNIRFTTGTDASMYISPFPSSYAEHTVRVASTHTTPCSPNIACQALWLSLGGTNQNANDSFITLQNSVPAADYQYNGGFLTLPYLLTMERTGQPQYYGTAFDLYTPLPASGARAQNPAGGYFARFIARNAGEVGAPITLFGDLNDGWRMWIEHGVTNRGNPGSVLHETGAYDTDQGLLFNNTLPAAGQVWKCNGTNPCRPAALVNTDIPASLQAGSTLNGEPICLLDGTNCPPVTFTPTYSGVLTANSYPMTVSVPGVHVSTECTFSPGSSNAAQSLLTDGVFISNVNAGSVVIDSISPTTQINIKYYVICH